MSIIRANKLPDYLKNRHPTAANIKHPLDELPLPGNLNPNSRRDIHALKRAIPNELHGIFNLIILEENHESRCIGFEINPDKGLDAFTSLEAAGDLQMFYSFRHRGIAKLALDESYEAVLRHLPDAPLKLSADVSALRQTKTSPDVPSLYKKMPANEHERHTGGEDCHYHASYQLSDAANYLRYADQQMIERIQHYIPANLHGLFSVDVGLPNGETNQTKGMLMTLVFDPYTSMTPLNRLLALDEHGEQTVISNHPVTPLYLPRDTVMQRAQEMTAPARQRA